MKISYIFPLLLASSFFLTGCGGSDNNRPTPTPKPSITPAPTTIPQIDTEKFLSELFSKVSLKFTSPKPSSFDWKVGEDTSVIRSSASYVSNPKEGDSIALRNYLISQGFTANVLNSTSSTFVATDSFVKENYACLIITKLGTGGQITHTKIDCANLPAAKAE